MVDIFLEDLRLLYSAIYSVSIFQRPAAPPPAGQGDASAAANI